MDEYEDLESVDTIAQGDVLEWVGPHRKSPWHTYGVVVTADCDLALGKHNGFISYIPAWISRDFLWFQWRPEVLSPERDKALRRMAIRLSTWRKKNGGGNEFSDDAVKDWLRRVGGEKMLQELGVTDKGQQNDLMKVIAPAKMLDDVLVCEEPSFSLLVEAYLHVKKDKNGLLDDVNRYLCNLPGDIFHIPSTPDGGSDDLFLLLRHIRQLQADEISARPDDIRSGAAKAKRIARVSSPVRYAITQNLAKVFADIGLSDDYHDRRGTSARRLFDKLRA